MSKIYGLGSNGSGQLGIEHRKDVSVPKEILFNPDSPSNGVQPEIRAGGNHTLLLYSRKLYCSGDFSTGACGIASGTLQTVPHFTKVLYSTGEPVPDDTENVIFCAATWEASIIVKNDRHGRATKVYSFGTGNKGELGLGELIFRSPKAQLIKDFPPVDTEIVDLAASVTHVVAVLNNGDVYGWGSGRKGQLGQTEGIIYSPRKFSNIEFKAVRAVCGREFTYLVGRPENGEHVVLGADKWAVRSSAPKDVKHWEDVGASWGSIFVLMDDGKLLSWGRDDHGQLAATNMPELSNIAVGSEHALALTRLGDVLAWGWGEHGNCGPNTTSGDVKGRWNVIASSKNLPAKSKIMSIGAGCATSWISIST